MKKHLLRRMMICLWALSTMLTCAYAQNTNFTKVKQFNMQNLRPIMENNSVKGYFVYLFNKKTSGRKNQYQLTILDNELNEKNTVTITKPKSYTLLESSYNGQAFCFIYMDTRKKSIEYLVMDDEGNELGKYIVKKPSKNELARIISITKTSNGSYKGGIAPVSGIGFARYGWDYSKKNNRAIIEMFDNTGKKMWQAGTTEKGKVAYETMTPFYSDSKAIVSFVQGYEKGLKGNFSSYLIWHNAQTGEVMFTMDAKGETSGPGINGKTRKRRGSKSSTLLPLSITYDAAKNEYYVCGEYFKNGENMMKVRSEGFFLKSISATGELNIESYSTWDKDVNKLLPKDEKGKEQNRNVTIHQVIRTADGKIFAIGEQFKKKFNGWSLPLYVGVSALQSIGVNASTNIGLMKLVVYDMLIFEFDQNLQISQVHSFRKDKKNVPLPQGVGILPSTLLGNYVKMMGGFDYRFTTMSEDQQTFSTGYVNFTKKRKNGRGYKAGTINYTSSQVLSEDKVPFNKKARQIKAMPAKPGQVTLVEYYRKGKRVDLRTEEVNH